MRNSEQRYENILKKVDIRRQERMIRRRGLLAGGAVLSTAVLALGAVLYFRSVNRQRSDLPDESTRPGTWLEGAEIESHYLFQYYIPAEDGKYIVVKEEYPNGQSTSTEHIVNKYLELCKTEGAALNRIEVDRTSASQSEDSNGNVSYLPERRTANIYLTGDALPSDDVLIGLVNTVYGDGYQYIKLYFNEEGAAIHGQMPEEGFDCFSFDIQLEEEESSSWADNWEYMVDIGHLVADENGNPVQNLSYHYEYVSGEYGSFEGGFGITDSAGSFTRKLHPDATYRLYLQKRSCVSYTNEVTAYVLKEMVFEVKVTESKDYRFVWKDDEAKTVDVIINSVTLQVPDAVGGSKDNVFLQVFTMDGGQVQLGYTDRNGVLVWNNYQKGTYYLTAQRFENGSIQESKVYKVVIDESGMTVLEKDVQLEGRPEGALIE